MGPSFPPLVQFSCSVMSDSLRPHESQHARPPCPSPTPRVYLNPCPSSRWCHPAISSSVVPFSSRPNPSPHQGLFQWVNSSHEVAKVLDLRWSQNNSPHWRSLSHLFGLAIQDKIKDSVAIQVYPYVSIPLAFTLYSRCVRHWRKGIDSERGRQNCPLSIVLCGSRRFCGSL